MEQGEKRTPFALWLTAVGASAAGLTGVGSMGQLGELNAVMDEQVRQAELRGQLRAEIQANRLRLDALNLKMQNTMPKDVINKLHDAQQALIDKLIDVVGSAASKDELNLAINKLKTQMEAKK